MFQTPIQSISVGAVSAGSLLGTSGTTALLNSINESLGGSSFFGTVRDTYRDIGNIFVENIVRPIQQATHTMSNMVNLLLNPDTFRIITDPDQLRAIPPCMQESIVTYAPIRKLLEQGRIGGFGYDPEYLPVEDVWGRLINNGTCPDVLQAYDKEEQCIHLNHRWTSLDPEHEISDIEAVEITRSFISRILKTTKLDPTDWPSERG